MIKGNHDSKFEKLLLGKKYKKDLIESSLDISGLKEYVDKLPKGINTLLGKTNDSLSGGQEQRLCLARTLYNDSPIMIFDEPTSALDKSLEFNFFNKLGILFKNKTIIIVTHNVKAIPNDFIIYNLDEKNN